jgi:hypothetical protein
MPGNGIHVRGMSWLRGLCRDAETATSRVMATATQLQHVDRDSSWPSVRAVTVAPASLLQSGTSKQTHGKVGLREVAACYGTQPHLPTSQYMQVA